MRRKSNKSYELPFRPEQCRLYFRLKHDMELVSVELNRSNGYATVTFYEDDEILLLLSNDDFPRSESKRIFGFLLAHTLREKQAKYESVNGNNKTE